MAPPMFTKRAEGWQNDPEMVAIHQKHLDEIGKLFTPLPVERDIRHLPEHERKLIELQDEIKRLQQKNAELVNELEERDRLLQIAAVGACRYRLNVHKFKMMLDWAIHHEHIYCSVDQNTKELVNLSIER